MLDCAIGGGTGFIFGSSKDLSCTFTPADKSFAPEAYFGAVNKYGLDIGTTKPERDALAGADAAATTSMRLEHWPATMSAPAPK